MLVRDATLVVTETDYARRWLEQKHPAAAGKTFRVFNGIDVTGFPARSRGSDVPRIVSVGRYVEKKGFPDLIEACRLLREAGRDFECLLIGGGPMEAQLRGQIAAASLTAEVKLVGPRPQREVRELLATADLFVLACIEEAGGGSDNLPTVIMEAMACGVAVVSTTIAGVPEMIGTGRDGLLVSPKAPAALAEAISRLLDDRPFADALAAKGQATAREKFAVEKTTAALKQLLVARAGVHEPGRPRSAWRRVREWLGV
jgi:glycosyltransferase involved in cell wall biosynthesis